MEERRKIRQNLSLSSESPLSSSWFFMTSSKKNESFYIPTYISVYVGTCVCAERGRKKGIKIGGKKREDGNRNKWDFRLVELFW